MIQGYVRTQPSGRISPVQQNTSGVMENFQQNVALTLVGPVKMAVIDIFRITHNVRLRGGSSAFQMVKRGLKTGLQILTRSGVKIQAMKICIENFLTYIAPTQRLYVIYISNVRVVKMSFERSAKKNI